MRLARRASILVWPFGGLGIFFGHNGKAALTFRRVFLGACGAGRVGFLVWMYLASEAATQKPAQTTGTEEAALG